MVFKRGSHRGQLVSDYFGRTELRPTQGRLTRFFIAFFVMLVWNGILSIFVFHALREIRAGSPNWLLIVFLSPFVLIGLLLIGAVIHMFLGLFNPMPRLTVSALSVPLGGQFNLEWSFSGRSHLIRRMRIHLEGKEVASYTRGTTTSTDTEVFETISIIDTPGAMAGQATVRVPEDTMHSFAGNNNKIVWEIRIAGEIMNWPDVEEQFPFTVTPAPQRSH